jgi:hypothetical protein
MVPPGGQLSVPRCGPRMSGVAGSEIIAQTGLWISRRSSTEVKSASFRHTWWALPPAWRAITLRVVPELGGGGDSSPRSLLALT